MQAEALGLQLVAVPPPVAVARARGAGYSWSTTTVTDSGAREFWTALGFAADAELGRARYCEHMRAARDHPT